MSYAFYRALMNPTSWPFDGAGRSRCNAEFDLLSVLTKCDFLWAAREPAPSVGCSAPGSDV